EIKTIEELYLAGQRIEQFHAPGAEPEPYWEEALQRDPGDARVNTVLGLRKFKEAKFAEAEQHFRKALERLTANYTAPRDGEALYYLGLALKAQDKPKEAADVFHKATWSEAWRGPAYYALAELATGQGNFVTALDYVNRSLLANALDVRALNLKAALLRHTSHFKEALTLLELATRLTDPLDVRLLTERWLVGDKQAAAELNTALREHPATGLETAAEYANAGLWQDGTALLLRMAAAAKDPARVSPLACYYLADFAERLGQTAKAAEYRCQAMTLPPDYVFPFQAELIPVLQRAIAANPRDARAPYYLGNLLFDWQPAEALQLWERAARLDPSFPIVHRNLAQAYWHQTPTNDLVRAIAQLEQAVAAPTKYALHFAELDELYAATAAPPEKRLALLEQNHTVVAKHDEALSREIGLKVFAGKYDEAIGLMTGRKFAVWEGGSLAVADHWVNAHLLRGQQQLQAGQLPAALASLQAARAIPDNLPNDSHSGGREAELAYWTGATYDAMGETTKATESWRQAAGTLPPP
ncbi:MAG TPA: tetratricopeptide repeat protein, partial [Bacillota bacterium]|nr:tetratricopeptide repeat protein [Bacillota bacterium]